MRKLLLFTILMLPFTTFAESKISVRNITGEYILNEDISLRMAEQRAIEKAKSLALKEAGIFETVQENKMLQKQELSNNITDYFSSIQINELHGGIGNISIVKKERVTDRYGNIIVRVTIDAEVIKYDTKKDPEFTFTIVGLSSTYFDGDKISFNFIPNAKGYLKIFLIDSNSVSLIYPSELEKNIHFQKGKKYYFPTNSSIEYALCKENPNKKVESNTLCFIFTKQDILFKEEEELDNLQLWISRIEPDKRNVEFHTMLIGKKNK
ncbi:MAG: DUF4384 domain-containing protein [Prevotellaceae bacterium]|nr:DUF4384 domain-containing protein [Prevotellaceae bacterium]